MTKLYVALVHHPIKNKRNELVTTSVTNLDIHDISRSSRTYGAEHYYIITPLKAQHELVNRILGHWEKDKNGAYNPDRQDALAFTSIANSIEEAVEKVKEAEGVNPLVVVTGANFEEYDGKMKDVCRKANIDKRPILLLFGTGWGLHASVVESADFRLEPLIGNASDGYNHLSVRSAVAIYLDRFKEALD
ncbi:MAG: hypothetical protein CME70_20215 [Halobacteriovorax sp.]|nr:hypothetical protein [Halobacteriovorax sp.]|tara:strand:- start:111408 stop:111977 length:570 start_codon:yes stop_codon:yes gene_type:complete